MKINVWIKDILAATLTLNKDNNWQAKLTDLPATVDGEPIENLIRLEELNKPDNVEFIQGGVVKGEIKEKSLTSSDRTVTTNNPDETVTYQELTITATNKPISPVLALITSKRKYRTEK